jgi:hypothetical protein
MKSGDSEHIAPGFHPGYEAGAPAGARFAGDKTTGQRHRPQAGSYGVVSTRPIALRS